jgi:hypothetical protein
MSSPQERKIAPLPLRSRSRSGGNPGSSQNVLSPNGTPSRNSSSDTHHSLSAASATSNRRRSYPHPDNIADGRHLSPPAPGVPRMAFQFGQTGSNSQPSERQETFTFRLLHNTTPRPSPEPEQAPLSSSQDPPTGLSYSSLPVLSTLGHEVSQPLDRMYWGEKTAITAADDALERDIPLIVEDQLCSTPGTPYVASSRPVTPLSPSQSSDLSPSPGGPRPRSLSDASVVSDDIDDSNPYDVRDEEAPLEPFFTPAFQTALRNGLGIANRTVTAIERLVASSRPTGDLERLCNDAKNLSTFQSSDTRTIAVLGDSGEGNFWFC